MVTGYAEPGPGFREITVHWTPATTGPAATEWVLELIRGTGSRTSVTVSASTRSHTFKNLTLGSRYEIRVAGWIRRGDGSRTRGKTAVARNVAPRPPPLALDSAQVDGAALKLVFSVAIDRDSIPAKGSFSVSLGGTAQTPTRVAVDGKTLTLTLATAATPGQAGLLTYTKPGSKPLRDVTGREVSGFSNRAVVSATGGLATAAAGDDLEVRTGAPVTLSGSGSSTRTSPTLSYAWKQTGGVPVTLSGATTTAPSFTAPTVRTDLVFALVVNDGVADSAPDTVTVRVRPPPRPTSAPCAHPAPAGTAFHGGSLLDSVTPGDTSIAFAGTGLSAGRNSFWFCRPDGTRSTLAQEVAGGHSDTVTGLAKGTRYWLAVKWRDIHNVVRWQAWQAVSTTGGATAEAGADQTVDTGSTVTLSGSGSSTRRNPTYTYRWTQTSGTAALTLAPGSSWTSASPVFTAPSVRGDLEFSLVVNDGVADSAPDTVTVRVRPPPNPTTAPCVQPTSGDLTTDALFTVTGTTDSSITYHGTSMGNDTTLWFCWPDGRRDKLGEALFHTDVKTVSGLSSGTTYWVAAMHTFPEWLLEPRVWNAWTAVTTTGAASIKRARFTSSPASGDTYLLGETVRAAVTWSKPVTVNAKGANANVRLRLDLGADDTNRGNSRRTMTYASGSGTDTLTFEYTVKAGDVDADGVWLQTESATSDHLVAFSSGATIRNGTTDAKLTRAGLPTTGDANHKVDGTAAAAVQSVAFTSSPASGDTYVFGETIRAAVTWNKPVTVDAKGANDNVSLRLDLGPDDADRTNSRRSMRYVSGSGTKTLTFEYTVAPGDRDADGVWVQTESRTDATMVFLANGATLRHLATDVGRTRSGLATTGDAARMVDARSGAAASAGADREVLTGASVTLSGSGSSTRTGATLTYAWEQTGGQTVTLTGAATATPSFTAPTVRTDLVFSLVVNDGIFDSPADTVTVRVRPPPNPSSAPCAQPTAGGQLSTIAMFEVVETTDSAVKYRPTNRAGDDRYTLWFCRPDGTREQRAQNVNHTHTETVSGLASGTTYWVTATGQVGGQTLWRRWEAVTTTGAASIVRVAFANAPGSDGTYVLGETIRAAVTWSMPVTVDTKGANDNVRLRLDLGPDDTNRGNSRRTMRYASGSGTDTLTFAYAVQPGDRDPDGVWVQTESAASDFLVAFSNGATIRNGTTDAGITRAGLPTTGDAGRKVDGTSTATAAAGDDREVVTGSTVTLSGSGSSTRTGATLTYAWTQTGGPSVTLTGAATAAPSFTAPAVRTDLEFSLVVNDGTQDSPPDAVTVRVRPPPNPSSAPCAQPTAGGQLSTIAMFEVVETTDSAVKYRPTNRAGDDRYTLWFCRPDGTREQRAQNVNHTHTETVSGLASGTTYWVTATGQVGGQTLWRRWEAVTTTGAASIVRVAFANAPGSDGTYVLGETVRAAVTWSRPVTVDAKGANANVRLRLDLGPDDADRDNSRRTMRYVSGSGTDTLTFAYAVQPGDTDADGVWLQTESAANDNLVAFSNGATIRNGTTDAGITRAGLPTTGDAARKVDGSMAHPEVPVAAAGADREVVTGSTVTLSGSGTDPQGATLTYAWTQTGGPSVTLTGAATAAPSFTAPAVRTDLEFSLVVNDGTQDSPPDAVTVRVRPPPNPSSAPCAQPTAGGQLSTIAMFEVVETTDSAVKYRPTNRAGDDRYTLWFCRPDGTREQRAQNVNHTHTETVSGLASGTTYWVTATGQVGGQTLWRRWEAVTTTGAASIVRVAFANAPGSDGTYVLGETVRAAVTWSRPVTVDAKGANANVRLRLDLGPDDADRDNSRRTMRYVSGSGTDTLTFAYAVQPGDTDADGVWLQTESAANDNLVAFSNGATIRNGTTDAGITRAGLPTTGDAARKVDGSMAHPEVPVAAAGADREVVTGSTVTLSGSGTDPQGATLTYAWTQTGGPSVTLTGAATAAPSFTAPAVRTDLEFSLVVNDGTQDSPPDAVTVRVRPPPNPSSAPCAQPTAGGQLSTIAMFEVVETTDSAVKYRPTNRAGDDRYTLWFCRPDGTREQRAQNVNHTHTETVSGLASGTTYWVTATGQVGGQTLWRRWEAVTTTGAASIVRVAFANAPGSDGTYVLGETVRAAVTWSRPVTVDAKGSNDNVRLRLDLGPDDTNRGNSRRSMRYVSGSGTDTLTFAYAVQPGDRDPDGVWLQTESATSDFLVAFSNGATIRNGTTDAKLTRAGLPTTGDAGRKVDGTSTATAAAGDDREVVTGSTVTLSGSGSSTRTGATLTYAWTQTGGPSVTLTGAATAAPSFTAPAVRTDLEFSLVVNDGTQDSPPDAVTVRVRPPPNPSSAPCAQPTAGGQLSTIAMFEVVETTDSAVKYRPTNRAGDDRYTLWFCRPDGTREQRAQNVNHTHTETVSGLASGTTYWVTATGQVGGQTLWRRWEAVTTTGAASIVRVAFANAPGSDGTYVLGETVRAAVTWSRPVTVDAKGANANVRLRLDLGPDDADRDNSRRTMRYVSGSGTDTLTFAYAVQPGDTDADGVWLQTESAANDNLVAFSNGATIRNGTTDAGITRAGLPTTGDAARKVDGSMAHPEVPVAAAGADREVVTGSTVTLSGSGTDPQGATLTYAWTQTGGPSVTLTGAATAAPSFTAPAVRTDLEFSLVVNDGTQDSPPDAVTVRVRPPPNPSSAPCAQPTAGGQLSTIAMFEVVETTDSAVKYRPTNRAGDDRYTLWFCRPDGTREQRAQNVNHTHTETVSGLASGTTYWVTATGQVGGQTLWRRWEAVTTTGAASIVRVAFANAPGSDGTYVLGETVRAAVTWSRPVTVDAKGANANVRLRLDLGPDDADRDNSRRTMRYVSGSGTDTLTFAYAVQPGDTDADGVWLQTESAANDNLVAFSNGATIRNGTTDAGITRAGLPTTGDAARKVDGSMAHPEVPVAAAGADREVVTGSTVTLSGSGTDPQGATLTYAWTQTGGPSVTLTGAATAAPSFTAPAVRTDLEFSLVVNDGTQDSPPDAVTVRVRPPPNPSSAPCAQPTAGGQLSTIAMFEVVETTDSAVKYRPTNRAGDDRYTLWFCRPDGTREQRAQNVNHTHTETVSGLASGTTYWVTATGQVGGQTLWRRWEAVTTTGAASIVRVAFANAPGSDGTYVLGETVRAAVTWSRPVTVDAKGSNDNVRLRLDLGPDDTNRGNSRRSMRYVSGSGTDTLTFAYAVQPGDRDPDGVWLQTESATSDFLVAFSNGATIRNGTTDAGITRAGLPTTGDAARKVDGSMAHPEVPVAAAGADREVETGSTVTLSGSGTDPQGATLTYAWTQTAGPTVTLSGATTAAPSFTAPAFRTDLEFSLTVNDGTHDSVADRVTVRVRPPLNPSSAPCAHPAPAGTTLTGGHNLRDLSTTDSTISFRPFFGDKVYHIWFCRPDGTRQKLAEDVGASDLQTVTGLASGTTYWVAVRKAGANPAWYRWLAFTTTGAASIKRVAFTNAPDSGGTYLLGETIRAAVTWSQAVTVDAKSANANVSLRLDLGADDADRANSRRAMAYVSGSGTDTLTFAYAVKPGEFDADGVWLQTESATDATAVFLANGATLRNGTTDVARTRSGLPTTGDAARKVDGGPSLQSASVRGTTLTLTFDEALDADSVPAAVAFTVKRTPPGGSAQRAKHAGKPAIAGAKVTLSLAAAVSGGDAVTVSYAAPSTNPLRNARGAPVADFADRAVANTTADPGDTVKPTLVQGKIHGSAVELTFSETLDGRAVPAADRFALSPALGALSGVAVSGRLITFTTATASTAAQSVSVGIRAPTGIRDLNGNVLDAVSGFALINTQAADPGKPALVATNPAAVDGTALTLTFDKTLHAAQVPAAGAFTVTVAGAERDVVRTAVAGRTVVLTLASGVASGETVTVSFDASKGTIQNPWGTAADGFTNQAVTNDTANRAPVFPGGDGAIEAKTRTLVSLDAEARDPDGDEVTYSLSLSRDDHLEPGELFHNLGIGRVFFKAKDDCELANLDPAPSRMETVVTVTAADPHGATAEVRLTFWTEWTCEAPALSALSVEGTALTLTFDEALAAPTAKQLDDLRYAFTIQGARYLGTPVENQSPTVGVSGATVTLTLGSGVPPGGTAAVSYDAGMAASLGASLRDADGNAVASFERTVAAEAGAGTVRPLIEAAEVAGTVLTLTFDKALDEGSAPAGRRFRVSTVSVDGRAPARRMRGVGTARVSGNEVVVRLAAPVEQYEWAHVWYEKGDDAKPLRGASSGPEVEDIAGFLGVTVLDRTAPKLVSAVVAGTKLALYYDEPLDRHSTPAPGDFAVSAAGTGQTVSGVSVHADAVTLTLGAQVAANASVTVSYTAGAEPVRDLEGNDAANLESRAATNLGPSDAAAPALASTAPAVARHGVLTLAWDKPLDPAHVPGTGAFTLSQPVARSVTSVAVRGDKVELGLSRWVSACSRAFTVTYTVPTGTEAANALRSVWGTAAGGVSAQAVTIVDPDLPWCPIIRGSVQGVSGTSRLSMEFDRALHRSAPPSPAGFDVHSDGGGGVAAGPVAVEEVGFPADPAGLLLTMGRALVDGERLRVRYREPRSGAGLRDANGNRAAPFSVETVVGATGPAATEVAVTSDAGDDATYAAGDTVRVALTFGEAVAVDTAGGTPRLKLDLDAEADSGERWAAYEDGSGTDTLTFAWTAAAPDESAAGVAVLADTLELNGGTIGSVETQADVALGHPGRDHDPEHKVDAAPPELLRGEIDGGTMTLWFSEALDPDFKGGVFDMAVEVPETGVVGFRATGGVAIDGETVTVGMGERKPRATAGLERNSVRYFRRADGADGAFRDLAGNPVQTPHRSQLVSQDGTVETRFVKIDLVNVTGVPAVTKVELASDAGSDDTYALGERVRVDVTFGRAVAVDTTGGTPRLKLDLEAEADSGERWAAYASGSGTATLSFAYAVAEPDLSTGGVAVLADTLALDGGTIRSAATRRDAVLGHAGLDHDPAHKVDWRLAPAPPAVSEAAVVSDAGADNAYSEGETVEAAVTFDAPVRVETGDGTPTLALIANGGIRRAAYVSGSGTARLVFAYRAVEADGSLGAAVRVAASGLKLNGGAIVAVAGGAAASLDFGEAPGVTAASVSAQPDGRWEAGDTVEATLVFAEPVAVEGAPSVAVSFGDVERRAAYVAGLGRRAAHLRLHASRGGSLAGHGRAVR